MEFKENPTIIKNTSILIIGEIVATLISMIGTIFTIRLLSVEEYSLLNIAYIFPYILILLGELGLNYASTHFIARKNKENDNQSIKKIIKINIIIKICIGLIFAIPFAFSAEIIAKNILKVQDSRLVTLLEIASIGIFGTIIYDAVYAIFLGFEKMFYNSAMTILRNFIRTSFSISLIIIGFGLNGPMIGFVFSSLIIGIIFLILIIVKNLKQKSNQNNENSNPFRDMIKYGYPLSLVSIIAGIQYQVYNYILTYFSFLKEIGYFNVALTSSTVILILIQPISQTLFPSFSRYDWNNPKEKKSLIYSFRFSIKVCNLLVLPVNLLCIIFAPVIFPFIFGTSYIPASIYIRVYFLLFLFSTFGSITIVAFLNGQKKTGLVFFIEFLKLISGIIFGLIFLLLMNDAIGVIYGIVMGNLVSTILGIILVRKKFGNELFSDFKDYSIFFVFAILITIFIFYIYTPVSFFFLNYSIFIKMISIIVLAAIYYIIYILLINLFSLIKTEELNFIESQIENIPIVNKLLKKVISVERSLLKMNKFFKRKDTKQE